MNEEQLRTICQLCEGTFEYLGSHLFHAHKMKARDYKIEFEINFNLPLMSNTTLEKKRQAFNERREYYLEHGMRNIKKYMFKKGHARKNRISEQKLTQAMETLKKVNDQTEEKCPVCDEIHTHMPSHLYNKHGLVQAK